MQFINEQYKVIDTIKQDEYGITYLVEDIQKSNSLKHLRVINLQKETKEFIEYMKNNYYDYSSYYHGNMINFYFFNRIRFIDNKQVSTNQYYYTYGYFKGINIFEFCNGKTFDEILDLIIQLCSAIKYLHLRGFLLCSADIEDIQIVDENGNNTLKVATLPYPAGSSNRIMIDKCSRCFKAPEVIQGAPYSISSDIYLIGAVMFYIFSGNIIKEGVYLEDAVEHFKQVSNNENYAKIADIIALCTLNDPNARYQSVEEISSAINKYFDKSYNIIEKRYIQSMPHYRIKPASRYRQLNKILSNIKGHFYADRQNKATLIISPEGAGKSNFIDAINTKAEQEGFVSIPIVLNESDFAKFSVLEVFVKSIAKYVDKELMDKYADDLSHVISQISKYKLTSIDIEDGVVKEDGKAKFIYKIGSFISEASQKVHMVFIIDNFQWIDEDSLELIDVILKSQNNSKTYVIFAIDREVYNKSKEIEDYSEKLKEICSLDTIILKNYNLDETAEHIRLILGMDKPPYEFARKIYEKTNGSPEYTYDTIYMLYSNGNIYVGDDGRWVFDNVDYDTINLTYNSEIDTLNNIYKLNTCYNDILKVISIFNIPITSDIIENFVEVKGEELVSLLNYLSYIDILVREHNEWGVSYSFFSLNLKSSVYESIPVEARQKFHEKASYILKNKLTKENRDNEDELTRQMLKANWHNEVKEYLLSSAEEMIMRNSLGQAIQFLEHAYNLFSREDVDDEKVFVCFKLGELYSYIGEYSKSMFYFNIVESIASSINDIKTLIDVCLKKYALLYKLNDKKASLKYLAQAKKLLGKVNYKEGLYELIISLNRMMLHKRKFSTYLRVLENTISSMDREKYKFQYARLLGIYGRFKGYKNKYEEGLEALISSINILESMGNYRKMLHPLNSIGSIYYKNYNEIQKAREFYEKCLSIGQKLNDLYYVGISYNNLAELFRVEDKNSEALQFYQNSLDNITVIRDKYAEFLIDLNMVLTNIAVEDYNKAFALLNGMEEEFMQSKYSGNLMDLFYQCWAEFYYSVGEYEKAIEYAQKAVDMCISWGIAENNEAHLIKMFAEIELRNSLDYDS
ncbi:MAG: AAA family ATPase, partial [Caulobacteraceae bacterium]